MWLSFFSLGDNLNWPWPQTNKWREIQNYGNDIATCNFPHRSTCTGFSSIMLSKIPINDVRKPFTIYPVFVLESIIMEVSWLRSSNYHRFIINTRTPWIQSWILKLLITSSIIDRHEYLSKVIIHMIPDTFFLLTHKGWEPKIENQKMSKFSDKTFTKGYWWKSMDQHEP